ncbi:peptidoglycan-binding protein [Cellulomonas sp. C5510]|uniref:peptidoglycan-binding domain-containing protein n=1 Tax=Cellulomonas sp. C5510 TaxID=2871170 RepID=UPI001C97A571|nr:peptidoglycan-binding domain-containing protein [Cellulomonas sp. C5510]QZN85178.1 peptidoglycan-binding protein [Cellulomonas sp. C5510]
MARARDGRRGGWIVVWALACALLAAAAATVVVLRQDSSPLAGDAEPEPVLADVVRQARTESGVVGLAARRGEGRQLVFAVGGTVTSLEIAAGAVVAAGETVASVDDIPVVAMSGSAPPFRALSAGQKGPDVTRLQQFLAATGYLDAEPDGAFGASTARAVRAWNDEHGRRGEVFDPASVVWIGLESFPLESLQVDVGDVVAPGQAMAVGPAMLLGVSVDEPAGGLAASDLMVEVGDVSVPYAAGSGMITDPEQARALVEALRGDEGAGQVVAAEPQDVAVVPATAVVTDTDGRICVYPGAEAEPTLVDPVGSAAGVVFLDRDTPLERVLVNPADVREALTCDS